MVVVPKSCGSQASGDRAAILTTLRNFLLALLQSSLAIFVLDRAHVCPRICAPGHAWPSSCAEAPMVASSRRTPAGCSATAGTKPAGLLRPKSHRAAAGRRPGPVQGPMAGLRSPSRHVGATKWPTDRPRDAPAGPGPRRCSPRASGSRGGRCCTRR